MKATLSRCWYGRRVDNRCRDSPDRPGRKQLFHSAAQQFSSSQKSAGLDRATSIPCNYRCPAGVKIIRRLLSQAKESEQQFREPKLSMSDQLPMIIVNTLHSRCQNVRRASCKMAKGTKPRILDTEYRITYNAECRMTGTLIM